MSTPKPTPAGTNSRTALVIAIAVCAVLLVGVGVTALVLARGGSSDEGSDPGPGPDGGSQGPDAAVESFIEATNAEDCEVLITHPITDLDTVEDCEDTLDEARKAAEDEGYDYESFALEIDDIEILEEDDRDATVSVDVTQSYDLDGESEQYEGTFEYEVEKDGDQWLVVAVDTEVSDPVGPDGA